jgi:hypothetical protein
MTIFKWVASLNTTNFAGHDDWRIPNIRELKSIVDYSAPHPGPTVRSAFNSGENSCTVFSACCTVGTGYWSATTDTRYPDRAWGVAFDFGGAGFSDKSTYHYAIRYVRAVRSGS